MASLPLEGITVLDLTHVASGPFCASMLGQLGADVIKIEPPGRGELMRGAAPFIGTGSLSFYFACVNVEKRYVQMDLKRPEGRDLFLELARKADVVVQNMSPGAVKRLGLDYEVVSKVAPQIVYCSIAGFRAGSRYEELPSFDYIHEAMAGVMSMTGTPGESPPLPGLPAADMSAGVYAVLAIVLALRAREKTGRGQAIEVPLHDCLMSLLPARIGYSYATGEPFPTFGRYHRNFAPFGVFETADTRIVMTVGSEDLWRKVLQLFPDLDRPEFRSQRERIENLDALYALLVPKFAEQPTAHWVERGRAIGIPIAPIMDTAEVIADPYVKEVARTLEVDGGHYTWQRFPVRFSDLEPRLGRAPRVAGADPDEVLRERGYTPDEIAALRASGAIV